MLNYTLFPLASQPSAHHLRGWLYDEKKETEVLELGNQCRIHEDVLAFTAMMPEIVDFLRMVAPEHPMAQLILDNMLRVRADMENAANPKIHQKEVA